MTQPEHPEKVRPIALESIGCPALPESEIASYGYPMTDDQRRTNTNDVETKKRTKHSRRIS